MKGTERCLWKPSQQDINNSNMEAGKGFGFNRSKRKEIRKRACGEMCMWRVARREASQKRI